MAVINFPGHEPWFAARWAFKQLVDRAELELNKQPGLVRELERAKALDGLQLGMVPLADQKMLVLALAHAARGLASDLEKEPQDKLGRSFIEELRNLDRMLGSPQ